MNIINDRYKEEAAEYAVRFVQSGMVVGLGHGSTAEKAIRRIAALLEEGGLKGILCVPCSRHVQALAGECAIPLTTLVEHPIIDLTIDGADEVAPNLALIKGQGGAFLHEKIVAQASRREIIIVDERKLSPVLGTKAALPVEVIPFGWRSQADYLEELGASWQLRMDAVSGKPFLTDEKNFVLDCTFGPIKYPEGLAIELQSRAGIVAHGLFLGSRHEVVVAGLGGVRELKREKEHGND